jgi:hypothetical protein
LLTNLWVSSADQVQRTRNLGFQFQIYSLIYRLLLDRNPLDVLTIARKSPERCQSSAEVENGETQTKQRVEKL